MEFEFRDIEHFKDSFNEPKILAQISSLYVDAVQEAYKKKQNKAFICTFAIESHNPKGKILVEAEKKEWLNGLKKCVDHFFNYNMTDEGLDTMLLIKKIENDSTGI
jgi:hypothetical protein